MQGRQGATSTRERALARRESAGKETRVPDKLFRPAPYCRAAPAGAAPAGAAPAGAAPAGATPAGAAPAGSAPSLLTHMPADARRKRGCPARRPNGYKVRIMQVFQPSRRNPSQLHLCNRTQHIAPDVQRSVSTKVVHAKTARKTASFGLLFIVNKFVRLWARTCFGQHKKQKTQVRPSVGTNLRLWHIAIVIFYISPWHTMVVITYAILEYV